MQIDLWLGGLIVGAFVTSFPRLSYVSADQHIFIGVFPGFSWIRCEGKGSLLNSPAVKAFGDERIAAGEALLVVDLDACTGLDSSFMGTLAGLAARIGSKNGGELHIAEADERNRSSLEDLGLDLLMPIDPPSAPWRGRVDEARKGLKPHGKQSGLPVGERATQMLDAHKTLSALNRKNQDEFKDVVTTLEQQITEAQPKTNEGKS